MTVKDLLGVYVDRPEVRVEVFHRYTAKTVSTDNLTVRQMREAFEECLVSGWYVDVKDGMPLLYVSVYEEL